METKNLCAKIPLELHAKVRAEQEKSGLTLGVYITDVLTKFYEGGTVKMNEPTRTLAFHIENDDFLPELELIEFSTLVSANKANLKDSSINIYTGIANVILLVSRIWQNSGVFYTDPR